jgi:hypothetical protein
LCSAGAQRALVSVSATSRRLRAVSDSAALWRRLYARRFLAHSPFARLDLYEHIPPFRLAHEDRERALLSCWCVLFLSFFIYLYIINLFIVF